MVTIKTEGMGLKRESKKVFLMIHGYTGTPSDFNDFPYVINEKFKSEVIVPRIKGHGTKIEDLEGLTHSDFYSQIEMELKKLIAKKKQVVLVGFSYGGQLALELASKYPVYGVISICSPIKQKFPLNVPFLDKILKVKKTYKKRLGKLEYKLKGGGFYHSMPSYGLSLVKRASKKLKQKYWKILCPVLVIGSKKDYVSHPKSAEVILKNINSVYSESIIIDIDFHNLFYYPYRGFMYEKIFDFLNKRVVLSYSPLKKSKIRNAKKELK